MHLLDITIALTQKELRVRYKHHALGYLWSIANPIAYALLYFLIFKFIMKIKIENYPVFLIAGLFPWQWFSNSIGVAPMTYIGNSPLIKKVKFPRHILNFVVVLQDLIHFVVSIPIIIIAMFYFDLYPTLNWIIGIPLLLIVQLAMTYSFNVIISTLNLFFRDIEKLVMMAMTFIFYSTPVLYQVDMLPENVKHLVHLNPCSSVIMGWKDLFLHGTVNFEYIGIATAWSILLLLLTRFFYTKLSWRFAEIL